MRVNRFLLLLPAMLAACSGSPKDQRACPAVGIVHDLKQFADFGRSEKPSRHEFVAAARMDSVLGDCH
ncbi:hypothetical protein, partial [Klebsiella variicola]|uniref:hypothetical protein n=1 Tax=Klebsiella variicola TaxID=244366 RepID=UPI0027302BB1